MQRFQLVVWPDPSHEWRNIDEWPDAEAKGRAFECFELVSCLKPSTLMAEQPDDGSIPFVRFDDEAQTEFDQWRQGLEGRLRAGTLHPAYEAHLAKFRSLVPSLALIFHVVDGQGGAVSHLACRRAITFSKYLESHARRLYDLLLRSDASAARALGEHILAGDLPNTFTLRDVRRHDWSMLTDRNTVEAALEALEELSWLRFSRTKTGGRPKEEYQLNPRVREIQP
jgi:putative DNA primase/helicase